MTNAAVTGPQGITGDCAPGESEIRACKPVEEKMQKWLDETLHAHGRPSAQKIRNFLNGTWLGEPLHVVLTDVPIGSWTVATMFDALDLVSNRREFSRAADTSLAMNWSATVLFVRITSHDLHLRDGRVLDGPAVHPQPCLEVRVRSGQIEVRKPPAKG